MAARGFAVGSTAIARGSSALLELRGGCRARGPTGDAAGVPDRHDQPYGVQPAISRSTAGKASKAAQSPLASGPRWSRGLRDVWRRVPLDVITSGCPRTARTRRCEHEVKCAGDAAGVRELRTRGPRNRSRRTARTTPQASRWAASPARHTGTGRFGVTWFAAANVRARCFAWRRGDSADA
jgi:hypothetical protein